MMNQADVAKQLKKLYSQEIDKLRAMIEQFEVWVDAGLQLRQQLDVNIANLSKAIADLDTKIEAEQRGDDVGDWWQQAIRASRGW